MVTQSHLNLYVTGALDCVSRAVNVTGLTTPFSSATTWNNQPGVEGSVTSSTGVNQGAAGCPAGFKNLDATTLARRWLRGDTANNGVLLSSANEADYYGAKSFYGAEGPGGLRPQALRHLQSPTVHGHPRGAGRQRGVHEPDAHLVGEPRHRSRR